jgi:hypothetical protein
MGQIQTAQQQATGKRLITLSLGPEQVAFQLLTD